MLRHFLRSDAEEKWNIQCFSSKHGHLAKNKSSPQPKLQSKYQKKLRKNFYVVFFNIYLYIKIQMSCNMLKLFVAKALAITETPEACSPQKLMRKRSLQKFAPKTWFIICFPYKQKALPGDFKVFLYLFTKVVSIFNLMRKPFLSWLFLICFNHKWGWNSQHYLCFFLDFGVHLGLR